ATALLTMAGFWWDRFQAVCTWSAPPPCDRQTPQPFASAWRRPRAGHQAAGHAPPLSPARRDRRLGGQYRRDRQQPGWRLASRSYRQELFTMKFHEAP